jgi:hypothetical protein
VPDTLQTYAGLGVVRGGVPAAAVTIPRVHHGVEVPDTLDQGQPGVRPPFTRLKNA